MENIHGFFFVLAYSLRNGSILDDKTKYIAKIDFYLKIGKVEFKSIYYEYSEVYLKVYTFGTTLFVPDLVTVDTYITKNIS